MSLLSDNVDSNRPMLPREEAECEQYVPWDTQDKPPENPPTNFSGFEQSLTDNVVELTKVVTSNTLKIKLDNFQPIQIMVPKQTASKVISLMSNLDHDTYPVKLEVNFVGLMQQISLCSLKLIENLTDLTVSVYVHSSNIHWTKVNNVATSLRPKCQNPFEQSVKLTELLPGKVYSLPLALSKASKIFLKSKDIRYNLLYSCPLNFLMT